MCSWQGCDFVLQPIYVVFWFFFLNNPTELGKINKCQFVCISEKPSLSCFLLLFQQKMFARADPRVPARARPFPGRVPPAAAGRARGSPCRAAAGAAHTSLGADPGGSAAVPEELPVPVKGDASRQQRNHNARCMLPLRAGTCLCPVLRFPATSPLLRSALSPLIPLDYAANPPAVLQG